MRKTNRLRQGLNASGLIPPGKKKSRPRGSGAGCESPIGPYGLTVRAPVAGVFADPAALAPH
jgi:hypothetical protein